MDKFAVVYQIGSCQPHIDETFDNVDDAAQYWYLGARVKESNATANGNIRHHDVARWVNNVYNTAEEAAAAAPARMIAHPGVAYFIQGFERKLIIDADGYSKGFEEIKGE